MGRTRTRGVTRMTKNVRFPNELLEMVDELSSIMKDDISAKGEAFKTYKRYNSSALLEKLIIRGFSYYIALIKGTCILNQFDITLNKVNSLETRLENYRNNVSTFARDGDSSIRTIALDIALKDALEKIAEANSVAVGMEINFSDMLKICVVRGFNTVAKESEKLFARFKKDVNTAVSFDFKSIVSSVAEIQQKLDLFEQGLSVYKEILLHSKGRKNEIIEEKKETKNRPELQI